MPISSLISFHNQVHHPSNFVPAPHPCSLRPSPPDYAQYLGEAAKALALSQPALPALLLVGAMCAGLSAATLWMQSVQLWVPLAFYRTEPNRVRQGAAWGRLGGVRLELEITLCELRRCNAAVDGCSREVNRPL